MTAINIIFDGPPSHEGPRFIEIENDRGESIRIGEWEPHPDPSHEGCWRLRVTLGELVKLAIAQGEPIPVRTEVGLPHWRIRGLHTTDQSDLTVTFPED